MNENKINTKRIIKLLSREKTIENYTLDYILSRDIISNQNQNNLSNKKITHSK